VRAGSDSESTSIAALAPAAVLLHLAPSAAESQWRRVTRTRTRTVTRGAQVQSFGRALATRARPGPNSGSGRRGRVAAGPPL
jgi:hypothetical protein